MNSPTIPLSDLRALWRQAEYNWVNYEMTLRWVFRSYVREEIARRTIAELRAQLAEAQAWEPLPDGKHNLSGALSVHIKDGLAALYCHGWLMTLGFDEDIRLCRRTSSAGNAAESE